MNTNEKCMQVYKELVKSGFKKNVYENKNMVFSPFSLIVLLGMIADGAGGNTKEEIVKFLGKDEKLEDVISWLRNLRRELTGNEAFKSACAVYIRGLIKDKLVNGYEDRLKELFDGELFVSEDAGAMINDINKWASEKTDGMIENIADESMAAMYAALLNAVCFNAKWKKKYEPDDVGPDDFHNSDGSVNEISMLDSVEDIYVEDDTFYGVVKPYMEVGYSYMAILPKEETAITGSLAEKADLIKLFKNRQKETVYTSIPEYKYEFGIKLGDFFKNLGIKKVFDPDESDFSDLIDHKLWIDEIIHKAYIRVDRNGTKAAAISYVCVCGSCGELDSKIVKLNRPFIYAIMHNETGLPVFAGVVNHLEMGDYDPYDVEADEEYDPEVPTFESEEDRAEFARMIYKMIANELHPDINPHYEESEEMRDIFHKASVAYKKKDVRSLMILYKKTRDICDKIEE